MSVSKAIRKSYMDGWSKRYEDYLHMFQIPFGMPGIDGIETAFRMGWRAAIERAAIIAEQEE